MNAALKFDDACFIICLLDANAARAVESEALGKGARMMFKIIIRVVILTGIILWALTKTVS